MPFSLLCCIDGATHDIFFQSYNILSLPQRVRYMRRHLSFDSINIFYFKKQKKKNYFHLISSSLYIVCREVSNHFYIFLRFIIQVFFFGFKKEPYNITFNPSTHKSTEHIIIHNNLLRIM